MKEIKEKEKDFDLDRKSIVFNWKYFWNFELILIKIENDFLEFEREIGIGLGRFVFENDWKMDIVFIKIRKIFNNKIYGML